MSALKRLEDRSLPEADRIAAAEELGDLIAKRRPSSAAAWGAVCEVAHDESDLVTVRKAALAAMARDPAAAVNQLFRPFRDPERLVRKEAVRLLRSIGVSHKAGLVEDLERVKAGEGIVLANLALRYGCDPRVVAVLRGALGGANRTLALAGLAQLGETGDVISGLSDPAPDVRVVAAEQLGYYSTLEQAEISALKASLDDPVPEVAQAARTALKRLGVIPLKKPRDTRATTRPAGPQGPWRALLASLSQAALEDSHYAATLDDDVAESGWLGFPGATDAEIADLSRRLGATLPPSYEAFLRLTNGFRKVSPFIDLVWPAREVRPFSVDNSDWIDAYQRSGPTSDEEHRRYGEDQHCVVFDARYLTTAIQISDVDDGVLLLNPAVRTPDGEWEAWFFANWLPGANRYPSFLEMIRSFLQDSDLPGEPDPVTLS